LEDIGIIPRMISSIDLQNFLQAVATTSSALSLPHLPAGGNGNTLNFSDFLLVLGYISSSISLYEGASPSLEMKMYHSGVHLLVQTVSEYFLALGLQRWNPLNSQRPDVKKPIQEMMSELPSTIYHLQPILFLCRRGGIIQNCQDFSTIFDVVTSLVTSNRRDDSAPFMVPASKVPLVISTSSRRCSQTRPVSSRNLPRRPKRDKSSLIYNTDSPEKYLHSLVGGSELSADALAISTSNPLVLFSSSQSSVSILETLYSFRGLKCLLRHQDRLMRVIGTLLEDENGNGENQPYGIADANDLENERKREFHLSKLFLCLEIASLLPSLVSEKKVLSTVNYILGRHCDEMISCSISEVQIIEILYGLAQIIFGGNTEKFSPRPDALVLHSELHGTELIWISPSQDYASLERLQQFPPQIAIQDEIDRFSCLLQLCDPHHSHEDLLVRLKIRFQTQDLRPPEKNESQLGTTTEASLIEFSSNFGYLFTQFITLSNLFYFESIAPSTPLHLPAAVALPLQRFEMPFIQKSLLTLLLLYPINDFHFSPWELGESIAQFSTARDDKNYLLDSESNFSNVQLDLRHILFRHHITGQSFELFLQHILQQTPLVLPNSLYLSSLKVQSAAVLSSETVALTSPPPHSCLMEVFFPVVTSLFCERNMKLLKEGNMLFTWEFLRCLRGNNRNDFSTTSNSSNSSAANDFGFYLKPNPFMEQFHSPFPPRSLFQKRHLDSGLSWRAVTQWAIIHRIESGVCLKWFRICLQISGTVGLHYSSFILFVVLCYLEGQQSSLLSAASASTITEAKVTEAMRLFYQTVSTQIQIFQRSSPPSVPSHPRSHWLFTILMEADPNQALRKEERESIINATLNITPSSSLRLPLAIPPRPEPNLWDAPRWLQYCKMIGLTELVMSFPRLWSCYQVNLHHELPAKELERWDDSIVPPFAIPISSLSVTRCLDQLLDSNSQSTVDQILVDHLIPFVAAKIDDQTMPSELLSPHHANDRQILFEDLFRFGGNRMITALEEKSSWFLELYHALAESSLNISSESAIQQQSSEPLLTTVCRYLSNCKLFTLGSVSVLVKQCFGFRTRFHCPIRPNFSSLSPTHSSSLEPSPQKYSHDCEVSLSFLEFQELVLRCAYQLWDRVGLTKTREKELSAAESGTGRGLYEAVKIQCSAVDEEVILGYTEECRRSLASVQSDQLIMKQFPHSKRTLSGGKTWGTDFLTPFCQILRHLDLPINHSKEKLELVAEQMERNLKSKELIHQRTSLAIRKREEEKKTAEASAAALLRPHLMRQLDQMNSAVKLTFLDESSPGAAAVAAEEKLKSVVERSEELVANILAKRDEYEFLSSISHPPSPPPPIQEQNRTQLSPASQRVASFQAKERLLKRQERMAQLAQYRHLQRLEQQEGVLPPRPSPTPTVPLPVRHPQKEPMTTRTMPSKSPPPAGAEAAVPLPRRAKEMSSSLRTRNPSAPQAAGTNSVSTLLVDNSLFVGVQEALWPVFATYCSCGDSTDPGKLSGPNLFTLLSKLDILTNHTTLSDIGILLHQISAHSLSLSPFLSTVPLASDNLEQGSSPLLSFEEFLIFLCAFSELRYDGVIHLPSFLSPSSPLSSSTFPSAPPSELQSFDHDQWLHQWKNYFSHSKSFSKLFHDCILPVVTQSFLLASPDDARERDVYSLLFSLDFLFSIETVEKEMFQLYLNTLQRSSQSLSLPPAPSSVTSRALPPPHLASPIYSRIIEMFGIIKLIPQVISVEEVKKLFVDIVPKSYGKGAGEVSSLKFPQWEWVSCVVAYQAVVHSIERGKRTEKIKVPPFPPLPPWRQDRSYLTHFIRISPHWSAKC
jgi:hypothetical protein